MAELTADERKRVVEAYKQLLPPGSVPEWMDEFLRLVGEEEQARMNLSA